MSGQLAALADKDAPARWWLGPMLGFDTETTGTDPHEARIVTASLVLHHAGQAPLTRNWLVNPGVPIPDAAAAVHGVTTERARAGGCSPVVALVELLAELDAAAGRGIPLVAMNAAYDLTVLVSECERHGLDTPRRLPPVLDPLVIDRHVDRYRRGKRRLSDLCDLYGVDLLDAHTSDADALAAVEVTRTIVHGMKPVPPSAEALHTLQIGWHEAWAEGFERWLRSRGSSDVISRDWPIARRTVPPGAQPE